MLTYKNIIVTDKEKIKIIATKTKLFAPKTEEEMFYEICFCLCSPQTTLSKNSELNRELKERHFYRKDIPFFELQELTTKVRFYQRKASFLIEAKREWKTIYAIMADPYVTDYIKREWLVKNVRGLGFKTASHFLRNALGYEYFAIIDTHICKFLGIILPKSPTMYKTQELRFMEISKKFGMTPMELDLFIFSHYSGQNLEDVR